MKYHLEITYTATFHAEVPARSPEAARAIIEEEIKNGEITIDDLGDGEWTVSDAEPSLIETEN